LQFKFASQLEMFKRDEHTLSFAVEFSEALLQIRDFRRWRFLRRHLS
jgi:hypothetical protein